MKNSSEKKNMPLQETPKFQFNQKDKSQIPKKVDEKDIIIENKHENDL